MEQHIPVRLTNRVGDELVANNAPIDEEILQIRLTSRKRRLRHPTPEPHRARLTLNRDRVLSKVSAANAGDTTSLLSVRRRCIQLQCLFAVVTENKRHLGSG